MWKSRVFLLLCVEITTCCGVADKIWDFGAYSHAFESRTNLFFYFLREYYLNLFFRRKDALYFEDGEEWCSTCTSSSDDSDYERWDQDESHPAGIPEEMLSRSRPNHASGKSAKSRHLTRSSSSAVPKSRKSHHSKKSSRPSPGTLGTSPIVFFDDRHNFTRPDWLLDPISFNPDSPCHAPPRDKKSKKKHKKKCVVQ